MALGGENRNVIEPTERNLKSRIATKPLSRWLITAAREKGRLTYGEVQRRLQEHCHFASIGRATRIGLVAGAMQDEILEFDREAPLLNTLLILQDTKRPGRGAHGYLARRFPGESWLRGPDAFRANRARWNALCDRAAQEVYEWPDWEQLYGELFGNAYRADPFGVVDLLGADGAEQDGVPQGRGGEGKNHKDLRLWVTCHPALIAPRLADVWSQTEVEILSGDRIDIMYSTEEEVLTIEVKSHDSIWSDLRRGIYQCVKYRAVCEAMERAPGGQGRSVQSLLVTHAELPDDLQNLATLLSVNHRVVSRN